MIHDALHINAINDNGERTTYQIRIHNNKYFVRQYNQTIITTDTELSARNAVECLMKDNGWHLEELVDLGGKFASAVTFTPVDSENVIIKTFEWMGGRYVQLGPEELYSIECAKREYGYC